MIQFPVSATTAHAAHYTPLMGMLPQGNLIVRRFSGHSRLDEWLVASLAETGLGRANRVLARIVPAFVHGALGVNKTNFQR
jgi:hypothetical protein